MAISFTPEQQKVIDLHSCNILVSAAAGSGKTAVLVERIIQMVCNEERSVDIDRLLIVTFTNAAAAEMRERIAAGITARLTENPESEHIQRQATLLHNAQITTIDSFCLFLLRNHFNEIGLDPAFRIADEGEVKLMEQEALRELLEESYAGGSEAFRFCVEYFCPGGRESVLERHILNLSRYAASFPWPEEWLAQRKEDYGTSSAEELGTSEWGEYLLRHLERMIQGCIEKMRRVQALCQEPDGPYMFGELVDQELKQLQELVQVKELGQPKEQVRLQELGQQQERARLQEPGQPQDQVRLQGLEPQNMGQLKGIGKQEPKQQEVEQQGSEQQRLEGCRSLADYAAKLPAVSFGRLSSKKDETVNPGKRELAKKLRAEVKESIQGLGTKFFSTPLDLAAVQGAACREPVCTLIDLVLDFDRRMQEKKRERKVIDFSDMEHFALDILLDREGEEIRPSRVALEYRQHFAEILIDEYQDSNLVQEYLLQAVSEEGDGHFNRFMVGDVKQSIYKFRLARPELFLEKYQAYTPEDGDCQRIDLSRNFRSRVQVVDAVNEVFSRLMSQHTGGLDYDERAALYPGASYPENEGGQAELLLAEKPGSESELGAKQMEARVIAAKIKELRAGFQVTDRESGELRPARFSDMVILLRSNSGWDEEFKEALEEEGIPVYITSKTGYFAATEVQELLQLLRVLDNPTQDIPLFGVMKSIFGGFAEEEIAVIRSRRKGCSLYEALREFAGEKAESKKGAAAQDIEEQAQGIQEQAQGIEEQTKSIEGLTKGIEEQAKGVDEQSLKAEKEVWETEEELSGNPAESALQQKAAAFLTNLRTYRSCTIYLPIRDLLTKIVTDFDYLNYVTALPAGSKRRANVEMLFTKASDFEKTSYFGLFHFVRYMEQLEKYDVDYGEAELLDENADVVRIMSIHKSKGLEFPITFVAGLSKRFNMQDVNQSLIVDMDLGLATDYVDPERRLRNKTLRRLALAAKLKEDSLSEELRVLYVALTRAREKLILTATLDNAEEQWELYRENGVDHLTYLDFMEAGSFLDMLLPVLGRTGIQVSLVREEELQAEGLKEQLGLYDRRERLVKLECREQWSKKTASEHAEQLDGQTKGTDTECLSEQTNSECTERLESSVTVDHGVLLGDPAALETLRERLNAPYQFSALSGLYTKTTVSELKIAAMADRDEEAYHTFEEKELQPYIPAFRRGEEKVSGTVRGNAYHRVMELLDFERLMGAAAVSRQKLQAALVEFLEKEVACKRLSREYRDAVRDQRIVRFLLSPLAHRMWQAEKEGKLYREQPFVLGIGAGRLSQDLPVEETVLIQGIIDVFFVEEDGLVLLDYKTDSVDTLEELWNRYETQMDYYQEALQKLMGLPVKERILYSFHLEEYG